MNISCWLRRSPFGDAAPGIQYFRDAHRDAVERLVEQIRKGLSVDSSECGTFHLHHYNRCLRHWSFLQMVLEEVRLMTKCETDMEKVLHIVLAGQDEISEFLDCHALRQLKQLVATRVSVRPLSESDVFNYVQHRWRKATERASRFCAEAVSLIANISGGIPRVINGRCHNTLLLAFAEGDSSVRREYVTPPISCTLPIVGSATPRQAVKRSHPHGGQQ
jgi:hypothetical protein